MSRSLVAQEENNRHSASPTDQQMKGAHQKQFRCLFPTCTHRKSGEPSFRLSPQSFRKVVRPPFDILNYTQKQGGTQTNRGNTLTLKKAHHVQTVTKIEGSDIQLIPLFLSLHFSQHIPLLKSHSPSMLRERLQERGYRRCARNPQKKTCPHFLSSHRHRCSKQGFSGTYLSAQEKSHRPKGILLSHHVETDQGTCFHCFGWDAGPEFNHLPTGPNKDKHLSTAVGPTSLAPCLSPLGQKSLKTTTPSSLHLSLPSSSVAIVAQAISCSNVRGGFPVDELFWF